MYSGAPEWSDTGSMGLSSRMHLAATLCLLLLGCCVQSDSWRAPMLRNPPGTPGTGCYFIVFREDTSEPEMQKLLSTISRYADDSRIYSMVMRVSKAVTVKLSPFAMELVIFATGWPASRRVLV